MKFIESEIIPDVIKIIPQNYGDNRGYWIDVYHKEKYDFIKDDFVQNSISYSKQNVLRGMHYQLSPYSQGKLVTCLSGFILDIQVDLRKDSETFGKWSSFELNGEEKEQVWIPKGFAHGFYTYTGEAKIMYNLTHEYNPESQRTLLWNDGDINIVWSKNNIYPLLSEKDKAGKPLSELIDEL